MKSLVSIAEKIEVSNGHKRRIPIMRKPREAKSFNTFPGITAAIEPPAITLIRLAMIRARDEPTKTASGLFEVALKDTVAS